MTSRIGISIIALMMAGASLADTSEVDVPDMSVFEDAVWTYVVDTCSAEALANAEVNADIRHVLRGPFVDNESRLVQFLDIQSREGTADKLSNQDKRTYALFVVSAYAALNQFDFINMVVDEEHLANPNYLIAEAAQRAKALSSLSLLDCLQPSRSEALQPSTLSGLGEAGDEMWYGVARSLYSGFCEMNFLLFARTHLEADFQSVAPSDRAEFRSSIWEDYGNYLDREQVAERCEDFS